MKLSILEKSCLGFGIFVAVMVFLGWISPWGAAIFVIVSLSFDIVDRDMAARKKAEIAFQEYKEEVRLLLNSTVEAIYGIDREGNCNFCNPACLKLLGYEYESDLLGKNMHELIHHSHEDGTSYGESDCLIFEALEREKGTHADHEVFWRADGTFFNAEYWSYPIKKGDEVRGAVVSFLDISRRKRNERRISTQYAVTRLLAESETLEGASFKILKMICESLDWDLGLVWSVDKEASALRCVEIWHRLPEEPREFTSDSRQRNFEPGIGVPGRVWASRVPVWIADIGKDKNAPRGQLAGKAGLHNAIGFPIKLGDEVLGVIEFFSHQIREPDQDLIEMFAAIGSQIGQFIKRRKADEALKEARDAAIEASRAKSDFLATMSHEIRTPLNSIVGMADLLAESEMTVEQREYVQILKRGGDTLLKLISDILDLAKVESGHVKLEEVDIDLRDFIERTCEFMAIRAHQKGLELCSDILPGVPRFLTGDVNRLRQVLVNLIGNAIKFTAQGEITIQVGLDPMRPNDGSLRCHLLFSVKDTGIGIPQEMLENIFNPFTQVDSSSTRCYGGTGLGLSISKKLVELMGGCIWANSDFGRGTQFYFTAELGIKKEQECVNLTDSLTFKGIRALVVDDNTTTRSIIREALISYGMTAEDAESGKQALELIRKAKSEGCPYELVMLDCRMPGLGGFEVARMIRSDSSLDIAILMLLNTDARSGDITGSRNLGLSGYLVKPVKRADLLGAVKAVLDKKMPPSSVAAEINSEKKKVVPDACPGPDGNGHHGNGQQGKTLFRLLLVDDSEDNRLLIKAYLKKYPCEIDMAENGSIGVQKFKDRSYDLLLMDMHMPVMDGYAATNEIRRFERGNRPGVKPVPIIALTANALKEDQQKSFEAGCDAYLTKPIRKETLLKELSAFYPQFSN